MSTFKILKFINKLPSSAFFLFIIFIIGFIATPYWQVPDTRLEKISLLGITLLGGVIWVLVSSGRCQLQIKRKDILLFLAIVLAAGLLSYLTIQSVIPWRGDEDLHLGRTIRAFRSFRPEILVLFSVILISIILFSRSKPLASLLLLGFVLSMIVILNIQYRPLIKPDEQFLIRYPFFNYWLYMAIPTIFSIFGKERLEFLYRIIPLVSSAGIAFLFAKKIQNTSRYPVIVLWVLSVLSMPLIYYYSSIYYLEPLAIFLMCVVAVNIDRLVKATSSEIKTIPAWYAFLLIGFIKETTAVFIFTFIVIRWLYQFKPIYSHWILKKINPHSIKTSYKEIILNEISITYSVLFPLIFYLFLRNSLVEIGRQYSVNIVNLFRFDTYQLFLRAFFDQFGFIIALWVVGIILFFYKKKFIKAAFTLILGCLVPLFFALDQWIYIGYSRFNLFMVPAILLAATFVIQWLNSKKSFFVYLLLVITITINILISPINLDGTKRPFWGNYNYDTSEHYYPFDAAFKYLKQKQVYNIFISGMTYPYYYKFYLAKYNLTAKVNEKVAPTNEVMSLEDAVTYATTKEFDAVIYPILKDIRQPDNDQEIEIKKDIYGYSTKQICNLAHCLLVLTSKGLE